MTENYSILDWFTQNLGFLNPIPEFMYLAFVVVVI